MKANRRFPVGRLILGGLAGWAAVVAALATWIFLAPHGEHFAPEVGPLGSFIFFAVIFSGYYLAGFLAITVPAVFVRTSTGQRLPLWLWCIFGGILFAAVLFLWQLVTFRFTAADMLVMVPLAFIAGAASFLPLPRTI